MIYVHGGSNKGGWSYEPNYIGARLAKHGVVVVSIAYRLGSLGFFSHPGLDNGPGGAVANFGLLDMDRLRTARDTLCPSRYLAAVISAQSGQGFVYYFSRNRPGTSGEELGVYHGAELPYVFDQHDGWLPTDDTDDVLSAAMMEYWSSFSKNGSPQATKRPGWPVFTASRQYVMELGDEVHIVRPHDDVLCRYLGPGEK